MGSAVVLGVLFLFLLLILVGMLRGLDWEALSRAEGGLLSKSGLRAVVGGGFLTGLAYGLFVGSQSGSATWIWVSRGIVDGLVVACAGAFYLGYQQRKTLRDPAPVKGAGGGAEPNVGSAIEEAGAVDDGSALVDRSAAAADADSVVAVDVEPSGIALTRSPADTAESVPGRGARADDPGGEPVP